MARGRKPVHDGQRFTVRLSTELAQRLNDRARGRADSQSNIPGRTHANSQPEGHISDIIREAIEHYLNGCDRELQS
jgi:predicted DNA-binding protein